MVRTIGGLLAVCAALAACDKPREAAKDVAPNAAARAPAVWTLIRDKDEELYLITQPYSVGDKRRMWLGVIAKKPVDGVTETKLLNEFDCQQNRVLLLQRNTADANGSRDIQTNDMPDWRYPDPDLLIYKVLEYACGRDKFAGRGFDSLKDARKALLPGGSSKAAASAATG